MRATGLGKVSHDKQRQAMAPSLLIAMVPIDVVFNKRRQSLARQTHWTQQGRPLQHSTLMPATGLPCQWTRQERREGVLSHMAKLILQPLLSLQVRQSLWRKRVNATMKRGDPLNGKHQADRANSCSWSPMMRASGSTKKARTCSKNKHSHHDKWNAHHARVTHGTSSVGKSTGSARDTLPRQQDECELNGNNNKFHTFLVGFLK